MYATYTLRVLKRDRRRKSGVRLINIYQYVDVHDKWMEEELREIRNLYKLPYYVEAELVEETQR